MSITIAKGATTITIRSGSLQIFPPAYGPQQVISESEDLTIRVAEVSSNRRQTLRASMDHLQRSDEGSNHGYDSFISVMDGTIGWALATCILTDADSDSWAVRYISPLPFEAVESPKNSFSAEFTFRVEI